MLETPDPCTRRQIKIPDLWQNDTSEQIGKDCLCYK